jgi:virulence factor Mce-like protein
MPVKLGLGAVVTAVGMLCAGCGLTVDSLPLPKPGVSGDTYTVHAVFSNVLNLPDHAKVKVGGSDVGVVTKITTANYQADVTMQISKDVQLPTTSTAELRQATPLGDVFVALSKPPNTPDTHMLGNGDTIGINQTSAGATVEELLLSVSALFNGGGIQQLANITSELSSIVGGKGPQLAHVLNQLTAVVGGLHANSQRIDNVLGQFNTTFTALQRQRAELGQVGDSLPGFVTSLADNNKRIGDLLRQVSVTSAALKDYADTSTDQLHGVLDSTQRLMAGLSQTGNNLAAALDQLHASYPKILATMRGNTLTVATTIDYLSISALYDGGSRLLPGIRDVTDLVGSLADTLRHLYGRVTSPPDPNYNADNPHGTSGNQQERQPHSGAKPR